MRTLTLRLSPERGTQILATQIHPEQTRTHTQTETHSTQANQSDCCHTYGTNKAPQQSRVGHGDVI